MPRFVSVAGKWKPAKEVVQLPLTEEALLSGQNPVYIGPDRGALAMMVEQGYCVEDPEGDIYYSGEDAQYQGKRFKIVDSPGQDCFSDPDVIRMARTLGYKGSAEYLEEMFNIKKVDIIAKSEALVGKVSSHKNQTPKVGISELAGGEDKSGKGQHRKGGFGDPTDVSASNLKQRA